MKKDMNQSGPAGAVYGLGFIGAAVYFIVHASSFWAGVLGFLKALVWPAFLVYGLLKFIGM
jgi:amino acid permease